MKLHHFHSSKEFYERVKGYLLKQEARNNLLFGIIDTLMYRPERYLEQPYLASVEDKEEIIAVALMTPPYRLVLSCQDLQILDVIVQDLHLQKLPVPGVNAPISEAKAFAEIWYKATN